jgi:single-strand DNA-binding protein
MYLNRVTLIGYLARDAESRVARDGPPYVILEVATKESWKDSSGTWQARSELHRCVAWGSKLVNFVAALGKGAHVQIEGSLRSREVETAGSRQRVWEIRLASVIKIDAGVLSGGLHPEVGDATQ